MFRARAAKACKRLERLRREGGRWREQSTGTHCLRTHICEPSIANQQACECEKALEFPPAYSN